MLTLIGLVRNSDKENVTEEAENNVLITVVATLWLVILTVFLKSVSFQQNLTHSLCLPFFPLPVTAVTVAIS